MIPKTAGCYRKSPEYFGYKKGRNPCFYWDFRPYLNLAESFLAERGAYAARHHKVSQHPRSVATVRIFEKTPFYDIA
jgi:hypothetical protein